MTNHQPPVPSQSRSLDNHLWDVFDWRHGFFILLMITLAMFGDVLFAGSGRVLSAPGLDLYSGELSGLDGAYRALRNGNVSLWSPHLFSGSFVLATVLYPAYFFKFMLPLPQAVNAGIAFHVFLAGFFMYLWASYRRLHPLACLLAAVLFMFCGPYFMHVFAGHVGNLNAMTWAPLIFLAVDGMMDKPALKWSLLGMFAVAMQMLTGQFQYVYYTAIAVVMYGCSRLFFVRKWKYIIPGLLTIPIGSLFLTAFQVLPVLTSAQEGVRPRRRRCFRLCRHVQLPSGKSHYPGSAFFLRRYPGFSLLGALLSVGDVPVHRRIRFLFGYLWGCWLRKTGEICVDRHDYNPGDSCAGRPYAAVQDSL